MKSLYKNSFYNIMYKLFTLAFPLLSSAYVSRILLPTGVGKVAYAQNIASYFITIAALGVGNYGVREIGKVQKNKEECSKTVIELLIVTLFSTLICSAIYYGMVSALPYFSENRDLYYVVGIQLILTAVNVDWFYQGMEEFGYITARSILVKIVTLIGIFLFVKTTDDIVTYALLSSLALAGNNIINLTHLRKYLIRFSWRRINLKKHINPLIVLLSTGVAVELYTKLDTTTLGILASEANVAYYNYATKITSVVVNLASAVSTILLPRLSLYREQKRMEMIRSTVEGVQSVILFLSIPVMTIMIFLAKRIIVFMFDTPFLPAVSTVQILSVLVIIKSIGNLYGVQVLVSFGKEKILFYTTVIGAISNIFMNIVLIPFFQQAGAAISSVISEFLVLTCQYYFAQKLIVTHFNRKEVGKNILASLMMALVIAIVLTYVRSPLISIIICGVLGVVVYITFSAFLKSEITTKLYSETLKQLSKRK